MIYLDSNATSQPLPEVVDAMQRTLREDWANPSSIHRAGSSARRLLDTARGSVAKLIGCRPRDVIFNSGGTEGANLAIRGSLAAQPKRRHVATTRLEHSVLRDTPEALAREGVVTHWLPHLSNGLLDLDALEDLLAHHGDDLALVSVMWVNNETGVIQPVNEIGAMCREHGVRFHTDAVQAVGKMPVDCASLNVDLLSFSGHKCHGPKGVGGIYVAKGVSLEPQQTGGSQESGRRGGTENVPGLVGLGVAADHAREWLSSDGGIEQGELRDAFEAGLRKRIPLMAVNGGDAPRIWSTSNLGFPGLEAEGMLMILSERNVCASAGAACASGSIEPSPVLLSMGIPSDVANGSVRFSLSRFTTPAEITDATAVITSAVDMLGTSLISDS